MRMGMTVIVVLVLFVFAGVAMACPASYVKSKADQNKGTALYDKSAKIADKYMTNRGMDPQSTGGQIARPYVIGTTLVEHDFGTGYWATNTAANERINLNNDSVDEAVNKALGTYAGTAGTANTDTNGHGIAPCWDHFNRHFGNGIHFAGGQTNPTISNQFGG